MAAYYNEIDPFAAAWLRELIKAGLIAPGDVDERSIVDVQPDDLKGYTQCHFFAGIGGWSYALRLAGWPDDRPVWTGSCPCQPFSAAGKGAGTADERHLWPAWFHLIEQCQPGVVFGEQVEAAIRHGWLDLVQDDLEGIGYTIGTVGLPAAGVGAPHIRQRLWFVAESNGIAGGQGRALDGRRNPRGDAESRARFGGGIDASELADSAGLRCEQQRGAESLEVQGQRPERSREHAQPGHSGELPRGLKGLCGVSELADTQGDDDWRQRRAGSENCTSSELRAGTASSGASRFWSDAEWLLCRDGKARPVEPGTFPLAHGVPARVGRLRGYGNAIVPQAAAEVIDAYLLWELGK